MMRVILTVVLLILLGCNQATDTSTANKVDKLEPVAELNDETVTRHMLEQKTIASGAHRTTYAGPSDPVILNTTELMKLQSLPSKPNERDFKDYEDYRKAGNKYKEKMKEYWIFESIELLADGRILVLASTGVSSKFRIIQLDPMTNKFSSDQYIVDEYGIPHLINSSPPMIACLDSETDYSNEPAEVTWSLSLYSLGMKPLKTFSDIFTGPMYLPPYGYYRLLSNGESLYLTLYNPDKDKTTVFCLNLESLDIKSVTIPRTPHLEEFQDKSFWLEDSWLIQCLTDTGDVIMSTDRAIAKVDSFCEISWISDPGYSLINPFRNQIGLCPDGSLFGLLQYAPKDFNPKYECKQNDVLVYRLECPYTAVKILSDGSKTKMLDLGINMYSQDCSFAVGKDGRIFLIQDRLNREFAKNVDDLNWVPSIAAISLEGDLLWEKPYSNGSFAAGQLIVDDESNLYYFDFDTLYSYDSNGDKRWDVGVELPVIDYCFSESGAMYLLTKNSVITIGDE